MAYNSNRSNIFRCLDPSHYDSKRIKNNKLLILKNNNTIQIAVELQYKRDELYNPTKLIITVNDFLEKSTKNVFIKYDQEIVAFTNKEFLIQIEYDKKKKITEKKNKEIYPISYFDFYCSLHMKPYTYYCLDCNTNICDQCKLIFFNHRKTIQHALKNIFCLSIESNIKILNKDTKSLKNIIDKNIKINNVILNNDKNQKHIHDNLIYLEDYKLTDEELIYYENKIEQFEKKLENSKDINSYENNILLLRYCKAYIDFYKKNKKIGFNYIIIDIIKNNIKFNENFLNQNNEKNNNELILSLPIENDNKSIFFMKQIHKITYPILDALNMNKVWDFETIISIFVSSDKTKFVVTLSTGIIKVYNISTFELLYNINFIDIYNKSNNNNFNINKEYFYAKMIYNGNIIVTNSERKAYLIKIKKNKYIIEKLFENYNDEISFFTEIPKNKHLVTGGNKINIYNYNFQKIISIKPIVDIDSSVGQPMVTNLVYLANKNLLICLMIKYGIITFRSSGITICSTKNSLYKIIWGLGGVRPVNYSPYSLATNKKNLVIFSESAQNHGINVVKMYNLDNGNSIQVNYNNSLPNFCCGIFMGESWILEERFNNKNNIYQFNKDFILKYKIKTIDNKKNNGTKNGMIKLTDEIICYFDGSEIIFLKY